jgi:hypothetical protein
MIVIGGLLGSLAPIWAQNPVREREVPDAPSAQDISRFGKVVEAQAFVLRGSDGKVRGVLAADNKGQAGLELFDESGFSRIRAAIDHDGDAIFRIQSKDTNTSCQLAVSGNNTALLTLGNTGKKPHDLALYLDENVSKAFLHNKGTVILDITDQEGQPMINLKDANGKCMIELFLDQQERPRIRLRGTDELAPKVSHPNKGDR